MFQNTNPLFSLKLYSKKKEIYFIFLYTILFQTINRIKTCIPKYHEFGLEVDSS